ncbi:putative transcription factor B3-Domain family [Helianthus annuus]|nr:putative transcription factor B3-Domain family [Helianthus annuus]
MVWGDHPPYKDSVKILDGDNIWFVRVKKTDVGPVLADGFTKLVRDTHLRKDDYLMFQTYGPTSFFLMVFKSCVHRNMFISKINPQEDVIVMADKFWRDFYGKMFKGGQSTLYLGDTFWNVNMDGFTDRCVFTHGCSEMINELALDRRSTFVFSMHGNKVFEVSVFNHETGTQILNNRVELVVLDDPIYVDLDEFAIETACKEECIDAGTVIEEGVVVESKDVNAHLAGFEDMFNDEDDSKFDTFFSSLLEMEDLKKKFKENWDSKTEGKGKESVVCDVDSKTADEEMIVEQNLTADVCEDDLEGNQNDVKGKSKVYETQTKRSLRSRIKRVDAGASTSSLVLKSTETTKRILRSRIKKVDEPPMTGSPVLKSTNLKKRKKTIQILNPQSTVLNFKRIADHRIRLPPKMTSVLDLSPTNLKEVSVQNMTGEVNFIMTRSEKNRKAFRYAFVGWLNYLKAWNIKMGAEMFFEFNNSSKVLTLTKVVEKRGVKNKKARP